MLAYCLTGLLGAMCGATVTLIVLCAARAAAYADAHQPPAPPSTEPPPGAA